MAHSMTLALRITVTVLGFVLWLSRPPGTQAATRPNFLFILSDDHAAHALSCYGSRINQTPNLDRIAKGGMMFTRCFVNNSICTPSRAAILTGKYSHMNGVTVFNPFDGSQPHVAKYLQTAGYQTAMIGKWHLFTDPTGFDYWNVLPGQGRYVDPIMIEMGRTNTHKGYVSDVIADLSIEWLKQRDPGKPFCLMSNPKAPHREWTPPARYTNLFANTDIPEPATFNDDYQGRSQALPEATMRMEHLRQTDLKAPVPPGLSPEAEKKWRYQRYIKDYLRCVAAMDDNIGRLLDYLEQSGLATNTVVIYASDQGFFLGDHGWFDKRFMYEEALRMPLLVSWPGQVEAGSTNNAMVMNIDLAPTLLELAGLPVPRDMQGRSLAPWLRGEAPSRWRTSIYYRYYHYPGDHQVQPHYGVRTERYKLIHFNKINEWELYDLQRDPHELHNVYADTEYAATVTALRRELTRLKSDLGDRDQFADELSNGERFHPVPLQLALEFDFARATDGMVDDSSTNRMRGRIANGEVLPGRGGGKAIAFTGRGLISVNLEPDPSGKPFIVGAWCKPEQPDGVLVAQGGASHGFALYLRDGVPHFALRSRGVLAVAKGKERIKLEEWVHLAGTLTARAEARVWVNGKSTGVIQGRGPVVAKPREGFTVGDDRGSAVGDYDSGTAWQGLVQDLRLYWGEMDGEALQKWADR